uniref:Ankyrin repeat domain-containing protein 39 n=1 Tax=Triatoma infestans TaxID=30076 RepID=A0A161M838_TRIIF
MKAQRIIQWFLGDRMEGKYAGNLYHVYQVNPERSYVNDMSSIMSSVGVPPVPSVHQTLDEMDFERGLWYPALTGDLPRVTNLLKKGSDPNAEDKNGYTPLHYAARSGFTTICTRLLEAGAAINKATRAGGSTPLHRAALAGNDDTIVVLIKYGANLLAKDADGRIALHRAVEGNHPTAVALLLEALPESSVIKDRAGKTPRHYVHPNNKIIGELFDIVERSPLPITKGVPNPPKVPIRARAEGRPAKEVTTVNKVKTPSTTPKAAATVTTNKQTGEKSPKSGGTQNVKDDKTPKPS